jgi:hypothetical protein
VCRSFCDKHEWKNWKVFWVPDKKSIFASGEENYDENDMDAPVFDDEEIEGGNGQVTTSTIPEQKAKVEKKGDL